MYYNWYDPETLALTDWPDRGDTVYPFASSVDNGWLAAALNVVGGGVPELRGKADSILKEMNFGFYYNPASVDPFGAQRPDRRRLGTPLPGRSQQRDGVWFTCNHYDITVTEPRIATYLGIAAGQIPPAAYYPHDAHAAGHLRLELARDAAGRFRQPPTKACRSTRAPTATVASSSCRAGAATCSRRSCRTCSCPRSGGRQQWGRNHPATVAGQIEHGLDDAGYGYWGFSPASDPAGGYMAWGVDAMGMDTTAIRPM